MVDIEAYMLSRRKRDLDNINKAIFDALIHSNAILVNEEIDVFHSKRKAVVKGRKIELSISKFGGN